MSTYFSGYVTVDPRNTSRHMLNIDQGTLGLGRREYYLDERYANIIEQYKTTIKNVVTMLGSRENG